MHIRRCINYCVYMRAQVFEHNENKPPVLCLQIYKCNIIVCVLSSHHALVRVLGLVGGVQQLAVLKLLTQPLQGVEWLIELYWHGHLGQIFSNVVPQDVPQAHAAGGTGRWQRGTPTSQGHHAADWRRKCGEGMRGKKIFLRTVTEMLREVSPHCLKLDVVKTLMFIQSWSDEDVALEVALKARTKTFFTKY